MFYSIDRRSFKYRLYELLVIITLAIPLSLNREYYYVVFVLLSILSILVGRKKKVFYKYKNNECAFFYPIIFIIIWLYGIGIGIIHENPKEYIVINFVGSIGYILYYFLEYYMTEYRYRIANSIHVTSIVATILMFAACIEFKLDLKNAWPASLVMFNYQSKGFTSEVHLLLYVLAGISLWNIFERKSCLKKIVDIVFLFVSSYILLYTTKRGGYELAYVVIIGLIFYILICRKLKNIKGRADKILIYSIWVSCIIIVFLSQIMNRESFLREIFNPKDFGNSIRYLQFSMVLNRLKIEGNGLGCFYNYWANNGFNSWYLIEISPLDMIDKYGIMALPLFVIYYKSFKIPFCNLMQNRGNTKGNIIALCLMAYFMIALGNPLLFAIYNVIAHCFSLFLANDYTLYKE